MNRTAAALVLLASPVALLGQPLPTGAKFTVNATTTGHQTSFEVAADAADAFRFVWQQPVDDDPDHSDVRTRRLSSAGTLGTDSLLSEESEGDQTSPDISFSPGGDWFAIWRSDHLADGVDLPYGRSTSSGGTILETEFAFHVDPGADVTAPAVSSFGDDYYVGVFRDDGNDGAVRANARSASGPTFGVSAIEASASSALPQVAGLALQAWVATWHDTDADDTGAWVRCHSLGNATGTALLAHPVATGIQRYPDVAAAHGHRFFVVYETDLEIRGRFFDVDSLDYTCEATGDEIQISTPGEPALYPRVDMAADGAFVVTWVENTLDSDNGIAAREFTKRGVPVGDRFGAHAPAAGIQYEPVVAVSATTFVLAWSDPDDCACPDDDVHARRFQRRVVFTDDFEDDDNFSTWSDKQL